MTAGLLWLLLALCPSQASAQSRVEIVGETGQPGSPKYNARVNASGQIEVACISGCSGGGAGNTGVYTVTPGTGSFTVLPGSAPIVAVGSVTVTGPAGAPVAISAASLPLPSGAATDRPVQTVSVAVDSFTAANAAYVRFPSAQAVTLGEGTANIGRVNGSTITVQCMNAAGTALESCAGGGVGGISTFSVAVDSTTKANPTWVVTASTPTVQVINSTLTVVGVGGAAVAVSGPLTDAQLRASLVPVSIPASGSTFTVVGVGGSAIATSLATLPALVAGSANIGDVDVLTLPPSGSTFTVVGVAGAAIAVSGPLTDAQLRATAVPVTIPASGSTFTVVGIGGAAVATSLATLPALTAGTANIGDVDVLTLPPSGSTFTVVGVGGAAISVTGPLTDAQLRASPPAFSVMGTTFTAGNPGQIRQVSGDLFSVTESSRASYVACSTRSFLASTVASALFNGSSSTETIRIARVTIANATEVAVTGLPATFWAYKITSVTGGTALSTAAYVHRMDTQDRQLNPFISLSSGATIGFVPANYIGVGVMSGEETTATQGPVSLYDSVDGGTAMKPLTLRPGQGVAVRQGALAVNVGTIGVCYYFETEP